MLKLGHEEDACGEIRAMLVTRQVLLRVCSSTLKRRISSRSLMSWISVSCHVANEESSHEPGVSFAHLDSQECSIQLCAETCWSERRSSPWESSVFFGFVQSVMTARRMVNGDNVFVRVGLFDETSPFFCVSLDGREFNPTNTSSVSDIPC